MEEESQDGVLLERPAKKVRPAKKKNAPSQMVPTLLETRTAISSFARWATYVVASDQEREKEKR